MERLRGADIVAEMLVRQGIEYIAGIPGHTVLDFVDALYERRDRISSIVTRNEETASYMADAYYRVHHRPMAVMVHNSVGAANALTGVMNAMIDSSAMIVISGDVWTRSQGRGAFQELSADRDAGIPDIFRGSVKRAWQVNKASKLPEVLLKAYKEAVTGKPGPVLIDITQDAFAERIEVELPDHPERWMPAHRPRGDAAATHGAADLLLGAERPAILAGGGTRLSEGTDALVALAERMNIPVATTIMGKGSFPESHPLSMGISGWVGTGPANQTTREADVLLALGCRFTETDTAGWTQGSVFNIPPTKVIQVDIDPAEIARYYPVEIGIVGDVRAVLNDLLAEVKEQLPAAPNRAKWLGPLNAAKETWTSAVDEAATSSAVPIAPARLTRELADALEDDAIVITDVGNSQKWIVQQYPSVRPGNIVTSLGGAAMGFGPCGALGARLAAPGRQVVVVTGDGSMSMSLHVLPTVVEYELPIVYIVANDYSYGSVKRPQDMRFGPGRNLFTIFEDRASRPYKLDFAAVAQAVGMAAERVTKPDDIGPALRRALDARKPYLLDIEVDRETYVPSGGGTFVLPPVE